MSTKISLDELRLFEAWIQDNLSSNPDQLAIGLRATKCLRELMSQELSKKQILRYLQQQMGIRPKSESGRAAGPNQYRESGTPSILLRQP